MIYDQDQRATASDMMSHPYFTDDRFPESFEPELRQIIELERESELSERLRRRRAKKVPLRLIKYAEMQLQNSKKENRGINDMHQKKTSRNAEKSVNKNSFAAPVPLQNTNHNVHFPPAYSQQGPLYRKKPSNQTIQLPKLT